MPELHADGPPAAALDDADLQAAEKLAGARAHAERAGRDPGAITCGTLPLLLCHPDRDRVERWLDDADPRTAGIGNLPRAWGRYRGLYRHGAQVVLAENGQQAVDRFGERPWDLVLMDIQMPVMGGIEATRLIRAQEPPGHRVPIIAVTANAMAADREACIGADMDDHLGKPYTPAALRDIIGRTMRRVRPQL